MLLTLTLYCFYMLDVLSEKLVARTKNISHLIKTLKAFTAVFTAGKAVGFRIPARQSPEKPPQDLITTAGFTWSLSARTMDILVLVESFL